MLSLPLPIVVALLLALLLAQHRDHVTGIGRWLLLACIGQSILVGLRFGYGIDAVRWLQPLTAVVIPPLAHFGLRRLQGQSGPATQRALVVIVGLVVAVALVEWLAPRTPLLDLLLLATYSLYGVLILGAIRSGADSLADTSLARSSAAVLAWRAIGLLLLVSASLDALIAILYVSGRTGWIAPLLNLQGGGTLLLVGWAAVSGGWVQRVTTPTPTPTLTPSPASASSASPPDGAEQGDGSSDRNIATNPLADGEDLVAAERVLAAVDAGMQADAWYRDAELNLSRLARLARVSPRQLSSAINRVHGVNVSQYVNGYRVREAQRRLREESLPVTTILYEVGFQTKSNFNREFRRVTGMSPSEWRQSQTGPVP